MNRSSLIQSLVLMRALSPQKRPDDNPKYTQREIDDAMRGQMTDRMTWTQDYPGSRCVGRMGQIIVGYVFPKADGTADWLFSLPLDGATIVTITTAKSEQAAKNHIAARLADWLRMAGLK